MQAVGRSVRMASNGVCTATRNVGTTSNGGMMMGCPFLAASSPHLTSNQLPRKYTLIMSCYYVLS
jgi:hypothetical protein